MNSWTAPLLAFSLATFGLVAVFPAASAQCTLAVAQVCNEDCVVNALSTCRGDCTAALVGNCEDCTVAVDTRCGAATCTLDVLDVCV